MVLVMDNDPKHTSKVARTWCDENMKKNMFEWPSQSPDINPIENLFAWLKHKLDRERPRTKEELKKKLLEIWETIDSDFLKPYWKSMRGRCDMVVQNNGKKIKY